MNEKKVEETICVFCDQVCEPTPTERGWASTGKYKKGLHFDCAEKVASLKVGSLAAQQSGDGWVSVEDAPNAKQYVLCYGSGGRQFAALYDNNTFMAYNPFNDELEECEEVTHWQPLPAPPSTE
jgi:hypothetical protein